MKKLFDKVLSVTLAIMLSVSVIPLSALEVFAATSGVLNGDGNLNMKDIILLRKKLRV